MDRQREQFWLIAACVAAVHAGALSVAMIGWGWGLGADEEQGRRAVIVATASPVVIVPPSPPEPNLLGEQNSTGAAISTVAAPDRATADEPDMFEQAWTRQQPVPLPSGGSSLGMEATQASARPTAQLGPMSVIGQAPLIKPKLSVQPETTDSKADAKELEQREQEASAAENSPDTEATPLAAAEPDPAEQGPSDLDPFAKEEGIDYTRGGIEARGGREVKIKRPRIGLAFLADATNLPSQDIAVKMLIETDEAGRVKRVDVVRSSESSVIDDAVKLAVYESWFGGKMPDRFGFTIRFTRR